MARRRDGAEFLVGFFDLSQKMKRAQRGTSRALLTWSKRLEQEGVNNEGGAAAAFKIEFTKEDKKEALRKLKKAALD